MGQARNRGTREQRVAQAIARDDAARKAQQARDLARDIMVGTLLGVKPAPPATTQATQEAR